MKVRSPDVETTDIKQEAHRLVDKLANDATWDDLMYEIYVRQAIERGIADSDAGRVTPIEQIQAKYELLP
jgi:predicted transcriptional regulator